jgi:predicted alpha/beta-fold hydrolase
MPEISSAFRPAWWLPGPHLPTIWGKLVRIRAPVHDRLERWPTPDNDHLTVARMGTMTAGVPHLLILHGLEATTGAKYAHGMLAEAKKRGWSGDLLMFRSCDGEVNAARRFYHSGETTDLDFVVRRLIAAAESVPLVICGVSLGGNVLLKWLGEQGDQVPQAVKRAAAMTLKKLELYPDLCDREKMLGARTFWEFDSVVTGPVHGFSGAHEYYRRSSAIGFINRVRVPTLLLSAWDDPFLPRHVLERVRAIARDNPCLNIEFSPRGGHVGWIEGQPWSQRFYMESRVIDWLARDNG